MSDGPQPLFPMAPGDGPGEPPSSYPRIGSADRPMLDTGARSIDNRVWMIVAVIAAVISLAAVAFVLTRSSGTPTAAPTPGSDGQTADGGQVGTEHSGSTARPNGHPPLVTTSDAYGQTCTPGFQLPGHSGWATRSGRGTSETSCAFAHSVLESYWHQYPEPSDDPRTVIAAGTVPCSSTGGECSGEAFVMRCSVYGGDDWITCTGGRNARVYIF